jgi:hypothetical protein
MIGPITGVFRNIFEGAAKIFGKQEVSVQQQHV